MLHERNPCVSTRSQKLYSLINDLVSQHTICKYITACRFNKSSPAELCALLVYSHSLQSIVMMLWSMFCQQGKHNLRTGCTKYLECCIFPRKLRILAKGISFGPDLPQVLLLVKLEQMCRFEKAGLSDPSSMNPKTFWIQNYSWSYIQEQVQLPERLIWQITANPSLNLLPSHSNNSKMKAEFYFLRYCSKDGSGSDVDSCLMICHSFHFRRHRLGFSETLEQVWQTRAEFPRI